MKEKNTLLDKICRADSFKVPDGYFDNLTNEVMSRLPEKDSLPEEEHVGIWVKVKPLLYMAAMFIGAALIIRVVSPDFKSEYIIDTTDTDETESVSDQMIDIVLDGAMMDDYSLYMHISDANVEY